MITSQTRRYLVFLFWMNIRDFLFEYVFGRIQNRPLELCCENSLLLLIFKLNCNALLYLVCLSRIYYITYIKGNSYFALYLF